MLGAFFAHFAVIFWSRYCRLVCSVREFYPGRGSENCNAEQTATDKVKNPETLLLNPTGVKNETRHCCVIMKRGNNNMVYILFLQRISQKKTLTGRACTFSTVTSNRKRFTTTEEIKIKQKKLNYKGKEHLTGWHRPPGVDTVIIRVFQFRTNTKCTERKTGNVSAGWEGDPRSDPSGKIYELTAGSRGGGEIASLK